MTIEEMACRVTVRWWDGYIETLNRGVLWA